MLAVFGLVVLVMATGPATASPRSCPPIAIVSGEPTVVAPILEQLTREGIGLARAADCPVVEASVAREHAALVVTLRDATGRSVNRTVTNARVAAIWIESWLSSDVATPLLAVRAAARTPSSVAPVDRPGVAPAAADSKAAFSAFLASGSGNDESRWDAVSVAGRYSIGRFRAGVGGRFAANRDYTNEHALTPSRRQSSELLLFGELPMALGRAVLAPRVGVGLAWLATSRMEEEMPVCDDPDNPECPPEPPPMGDGFAVSSMGARAELGLTLSLPIVDGVALDLGVTYQVAPFAHGAGFYPPELDEAGEPTDPNGDPIVDPILALPGEPRSLLWWGLGLRIGGV